ncbi:transposase [Patescibacteria group bacterium]|nr:transposase [Patescibacteria group bacterium]MBU1907404.1 transposase [Patescibacteria group bacterium]
MSRFFIDDSWYFITVPTKEHVPFFTGDKRGIILERICKACDQFAISNYDFGIMSDHYHFLAQFSNANIIPKLLNFINGGAAYEIGNVIARGKGFGVSITS